MAKFGDYCSSLEQVFYRELDADEHLIWTGKPYPGLMLRFNDFLLVPVSMLSCFVSFLTAKILFVHCNTTGFHSVSLIPDVFFFPAGLGFILVGLNMVLGRFFYRQHAQMAYVLCHKQQKSDYRIHTFQTYHPQLFFERSQLGQSG